MFMSSGQTNSTTPPSATGKKEAAITLIRGFAFVLANARTYGLNHKIAREAADMVFRAVTAYHRAYGPFSFELHEGAFAFEGEALSVNTPALESLVGRFAELGVKDISFDPGVADGEFFRFLEIICSSAATPGGLPFGKQLAASGFSKIRSGHFVLRKVAEDEVVVNRQNVATHTFSNASRVKTANRLLDSAPRDMPMPAIKIELNDSATVNALAEVAVPQSLREGAGNADELVNESIFRLKRLTDGLAAFPSNRTQKGRHALRKLLKTAQENIAAQLEKLGADIEAVQRLADSVKELVEDIAVDGIAARYAKLREQVANDEKRLQRRLRGAARRGGADERNAFCEKLRGAGLSDDMIFELLADSEKNAGGRAAGSASRTSAADKADKATAHLSSLLGKLKKADLNSDEAASLIDDILGEMSKALLDTKKSAEQQLEVLRKITGQTQTAEQSRTKDAPGKNPPQERSATELLNFMSELGQQLKQPLTVIKGGVEMILGGYADHLDGGQKPILSLVFNGVEELTQLIEQVTEVAGLPQSLQPRPGLFTRKPAPEQSAIRKKD